MGLRENCLDPACAALLVPGGQCAFDEWETVGRRLNDPGAIARIAKLLAAFRDKGVPPLTRQIVSYHVGLAVRRAGSQGDHPHTPRHSCGYYLANKGHDLRLIQNHLGHRGPKHTIH